MPSGKPRVGLSPKGAVETGHTKANSLGQAFVLWNTSQQRVWRIHTRWVCKSFFCCLHPVWTLQSIGLDVSFYLLSAVASTSTSCVNGAWTHCLCSANLSAIWSQNLEEGPWGWTFDFWGFELLSISEPKCGFLLFWEQAGPAGHKTWRVIIAEMEKWDRAGYISKLGLASLTLQCNATDKRKDVDSSGTSSVFLNVCSASQKLRQLKECTICVQRKETRIDVSPWWPQR